MHTRAPPPNSISINPARSIRRRRGGGSGSGTISPGTIGPPSGSARGSFGSSSRRHLNSWLVFTSCRRATIDTDEPASSVSATICRLSSSGQSRRLAGRDCLVSTKPLVDTSFAVAAMRPILAPINDQRQALLTERLHQHLGLLGRSRRRGSPQHSG